MPSPVDRRTPDSEVSPPSQDAPASGRIIEAKIRPPLPRVDVVRRERLVRRLDDPRHRLVLVSAPAGFGKSVLALDWLTGTGRPAAWLSIDPLDSDPRRFFTHLAAALRRVPDPACQEAAGALDRLAEGSRDRGAVTAALVAADASVTLVLDDVHMATASRPRSAQAPSQAPPRRSQEIGSDTAARAVTSHPEWDTMADRGKSLETVDTRGGHNDGTTRRNFAHPNYDHSLIGVTHNQSSPHGYLLNGMGYTHISGGIQVHLGSSGGCDASSQEDEEQEEDGGGSGLPE